MTYKNAPSLNEGIKKLPRDKMSHKIDTLKGVYDDSNPDPEKLKRANKITSVSRFHHPRRSEDRSKRNKSALMPRSKSVTSESKKTFYDFMAEAYMIKNKL